MSTLMGDEYSDELNERQPRVRSGCTIGRVLNLCMALDFLLVMITALIVSGTLGAVNLTLKSSYADRPGEGLPLPYEVCILYSSCDGDPGASCAFHYNTSGVCKYTEVAFGFIALVALVYIVVSIVRAILTTNISFTVFVDFGMVLLCVVVAFTTGVAVSIGLSVTCTSIKSSYSNPDNTCDLTVPGPQGDTTASPPGYAYYRPVNISQSCSWLCFAFLMVLLIMTIARMIIFFTRRRTLHSDEGNVDDITDVLTREDPDDDDESKPI